MGIANKIANPSRRAFMVTTGVAAGGFALGFFVPGLSPAKAAKSDVPEINAWVVVKPDDTVVVRVARSEMGQGTLTGLSQLVADELDADWSKVTAEYPTPGENLKRNRVWRDFSTGGSRGVRGSQDYMRRGGAAARQMLIEAAAEAWKVPPGECTAANSVITHKGSGRTVTYGKVAAAAAKLTPPIDVTLKDPKDWKIAGKTVKRLDTADKLTGKQIYGMDLKLPGMLNAAIIDCPHFGGKVKTFDAAKVSGMPGVKKVVPVGDTALAVVADTYWHAKTALDALPIEWDKGPHGDVDSAKIAAMLKEGLSSKQAFVGNKAGDVDAALKGAAKRVEAVYAYPFQNHACMEVMNATAVWTPESCEVWTPTQNGEGALASAAAAAGLPVGKCEVHKIHLGGGFGRRGMSDYEKKAVLIAKQFPGTPVKMLWSREEDMRQGRFHPITQCKMVGGLDKDGNLTGLHMRLSGQSILAIVRPHMLKNGADMLAFQGLLKDGDGQIGYDIPNLLIDHAMRNTHVPPGFWRGVNHNHNSIYLESFMDELAHAAGQDPLAFRRKLMAKTPKHLAVLNAVAAKIGWDTKPPAGVFRGIAQHKGFGTYTAAAAEVSVSKSGQLKMHRIVAAVDSGHAVNPGQIQAQTDGSFTYGLSALLYGECTVKEGRIEQENFDTYNVLRMDEMPAVEAIVMPSGGFWGGIGEPTISVAAPAVLNAIFAATGRRVRSFPLKNADLKTA